MTIPATITVRIRDIDEVHDRLARADAEIRRLRLALIAIRGHYVLHAQDGLDCCELTRRMAENALAVEWIP